LAWLGIIFGEHWEKIKDYMHYISIAILIAVILFIMRWFWKNLNGKKE